MGAAPVAIVNETFARYYFGAGQSDLAGASAFSAHNDAARMEIVGVVKDTQRLAGASGRARRTARSSLRVPTEGVPRVVYTPYQQSDELGRDDRLPAGVCSRRPGHPGDRAARPCSAPIRTLPVFRMTTMAAHRR